MIINSTEIQNNFGKYLKLAEFEDIIITKNGRKMAKLIQYREDVEDFVIREGSSVYSHDGMKVSYEEFLKITEESENRYEYIDGEIYLLASPLYEHQKAIMAILAEFISWFRGKECEPIVSPFDVTLFKEKKYVNVVQPDILVICDKENINEKGKYTGIPSLVVEILSESTRRKDLIKKLDLYMLSGVKEYWIANTFSKEIYLYVFKDYNIESMMTFKTGEIVKSVIFNGLKVQVEQVFA
ncbi:MAG: type II toxin-antitoxin system Phd/YefM family antitoxin [Firmicutes bacterium]|nr:type II toxin-antitoxin system Phd/YefM family antitoxin [Bacillota bacterium]